MHTVCKTVDQLAAHILVGNVTILNDHLKATKLSFSDVKLKYWNWLNVNYYLCLI